MYISYSGFKLYVQCPYAYWHRYVNKTQVTPENIVNALYGTIVGLVFESFYRDKLWRHKDYIARLYDLIEVTYQKTVRERQDRKNGVVDWLAEGSNYPSKIELVQDIRLAIPRGLRIIKTHRFLGTYSEAELKLDSKIGDHTIGGRADFVIHRIEPHKDLVILDGKGTKWHMSYTDPRQLKWYAMLHKIRRGTMPDKIGFVFWRFEPDESVVWIPFTQADLDALQLEITACADRIAKTTAQIDRLVGKTRAEAREEFFPAQPSEDCKRCSYLEVCEEGKAKQAPKKKPRVELPGSGVRELGLDDEE